MLSAGTAFDESRNGVGGSLLGRRIVFGSSFNLLLYRLPSFKVDDGFVRSLGMVLRLFSSFRLLSLGEVIFAVGLL